MKNNHPKEIPCIYLKPIWLKPEIELLSFERTEGGQNQDIESNSGMWNS